MKTKYLSPEERKTFRETIQKCVQDGVSDIEIARITGRGKTLVGSERRAMGLENGSEAHRPGGKYERERSSVEDVDIRARVYQGFCRGLLTCEIADDENLTIMQVEVYRKQMPKWWCRSYSHVK